MMESEDIETVSSKIMIYYMTLQVILNFQIKVNNRFNQ